VETTSFLPRLVTNIQNCHRLYLQSPYFIYHIPSSGSSLHVNAQSVARLLVVTGHGRPTTAFCSFENHHGVCVLHAGLLSSSCVHEVYITQECYLVGEQDFP